MSSLFDNVKVYNSWKRVENSIHKATEEELKMIKDVEVTNELYGPRLRIELHNGGVAFIDLDRECQLAIGDKPDVANLEFAYITNEINTKKVVL